MLASDFRGLCCVASARTASPATAAGLRSFICCSRAQSPCPGPSVLYRKITSRRTVRSAAWNFFHTSWFSARRLRIEGGFRVQFLSCGSTVPAILATLCKGPDRKSSVGGCLCRCHAGSPDRGSRRDRGSEGAAGRPLSAIHENLEFGLGQRRRHPRGGRAAGRAEARQYHAPPPPGISAGGARRLLGAGC